MADIVLSEKKKVNIFDRIIQTVVIMVNMNKMNRAIEEHLNTIVKLEEDRKKEYEQNILKEIVFVKYQYDIMQREMYELKNPYSEEIVDHINSVDKIERLKLQKLFLEMEYDRITKVKFKSKEDIKYYLMILSSVMDDVKQEIKNEGKNKKYNNLINFASGIDTKIQTGEYEEVLYKEVFEIIDDYVGYINDNYDIARLPNDERELIEFVIETMLTGIQSDIDRHMYEYKILINICKNSYRYFNIINKVFNKIVAIYDESLLNDVITLKDYIRAYKEIYDLKIKTMVNDVHRTIKTEDEYLEYSRFVANFMYDELDNFILERALEECINDDIKVKILTALNREIPEQQENMVLVTEQVEEKKSVTLKEKIKKVADKVSGKVKIKKEKPIVKKIAKKKENKKEKTNEG